MVFEHLRVRALSAAPLLVVAAGCVGIPSGIEYPDVSGVPLDGVVVTPEGDGDPSVTLGAFRFGPKACEGIDTHMVTATLDQEDLNRFFASRGLTMKAKKARDDLWWYEFPSAGEQGGAVRLRLAILKDRVGAAKDLHDSLLQHGPGWWGVRRGNLAILAPKADLDEAVRFAAKHKLMCWGMFTYAGVDDAYAVTGGYSEF
jgi:hypothetical protein